MRSPCPADTPVFILCGGMGTRLGELTAHRPKPMVAIGERPIIEHIMHWYARFGFRRFVLCTGYRSEVINAHFAQFQILHDDFTVRLRDGGIRFHPMEPPPDWDVTLAHTGEATMTGARVARAAIRYLGEAEHFAVTYGDGLTDSDLGAEFAFHLAHDRLATVLGVHPPSQFGRFQLNEDAPPRFEEKPLATADWINGGFFFFRRAALDYLSTEAGCTLEQAPLSRLTAEGQLEVFKHDGFWSCMDTVRDRDRMQALWEGGAAPWRLE